MRHSSYMFLAVRLCCRHASLYLELMVLIAPTYAHILIAQRYPYSSTVRSLQQGHFSSAAAGPGPCRLDAVEPAGARAPFDQHAFGAFAVRTSRYSPVVQVRTGPYRPVAREYPYMQATHRASPAQSPRQAAARCSPPGLPRPRPLRRLLQRSPACSGAESAL